MELANPDHLRKLQEGVKAWNKWREDNPKIVPDLNAIDLSTKEGAGELWSREWQHADLCLFEAPPGGPVGVNLSHAQLESANLSRTVLTGAFLSNANLQGADLSGASLQGANLSGASLYKANLSKANLEEANLADATVFYGKLCGASLRKANLRGAYLYEADLFKANLLGANLSDVVLSSANLSQACLSSTNLARAELRNVDLRGLDLRTCDLVGVDLYGAQLGNTVFTVEQLGGNARSRIKTGIINQVCARYLRKEGSVDSIDPDLVFPGENNAGKMRKRACIFLDDKICTWEKLKDTESHWLALKRRGGKKDWKVKEFFDEAKEVYLSLKNNWIGLGRYDDASWAAAMEKRMEGEILRFEALESVGEHIWWTWLCKLLKCFGNRFYDWLCDYGENPWKLLWWALGVIFVFAVLYGVFGIQVLEIGDGKTLRVPFKGWASFWDSRVGLLSLLYFSGRAFTAASVTDVYPMGSVSEMLFSIEPLLGLFLAAMFVWTLGRRVASR